MAHEWVLLAIPFLLLMGFEILAKTQFRRAPEVMPGCCFCRNWTGKELCLLGFIFLLSTVPGQYRPARWWAAWWRAVPITMGGDRIPCRHRGRSQCGRRERVIGDTTTSHAVDQRVSAMAVAPAFIGAGAAFAVFGVAAAIQQHHSSLFSRIS